MSQALLSDFNGLSCAFMGPEKEEYWFSPFCGLSKISGKISIMKSNIHISQSFKMVYMNPLFARYLQHSQEKKRIFNFQFVMEVAWGNLSCHTWVWVRGQRLVAASFIFFTWVPRMEFKSPSSQDKCLYLTDQWFMYSFLPFQWV